MNRIKLNRWLISIFAFALFVLVFSPEEIRNTIAIETKIPDSDYFMKDVAIYKFNQTGTQTNKLSATRLEHSSISDLSIIDDPTLSFTKEILTVSPGDSNTKNSLSTRSWWLRSKQGELTDNKRFMTLIGKVKITERLPNETVQTTIDTADLVLDLFQNVASTQEKVVIMGNRYKTESLGLDIQFEKEIFRLKKDVSTEIYR